ncbi:hypothetical protein D3C71_2187200 [compost metagenome]
MVELPSAPWHAAQTAAKLAPPFAKSSLAFVCGAAGVSPAEKAGKAEAAKTAAVSKEASNFISRVCC